MARKNLSRLDATDLERSNLEYVLKKESEVKDNTKYISVEDALDEEAVFEISSDRNITRVLFISKDDSLLNPMKQSLDGYINLTDLFDEVHILILRQGIKAKNPVLRVAKNLWLYTATAKDWWQTPTVGASLIEQELIFAGGFRPDIIIARDPFESAYLGKKIAKKYGRPFQVHILEDYTIPDFVKKNQHNKWRKYLPYFTMRGVRSVRTATKQLMDLVYKKFSPENLAILPKFNNFEAIMKAEATLDLRDKYRPFVFIILYIGKLNHSSALHFLIDAARFGLHNTHIGLLVLGDGPTKKEFQERAKILGVLEQVVFISDVKDNTPYLKSANVLVVPDTNEESEDVVLRGAAAGIPLVLARTDRREDVFKDGESALLYDQGAVDDLSVKLNMLMNDVPLRRHLTETASLIMRTKFYEDPVSYRIAYRESIEEVLFLPDLDENEVIDDVQ